MQTDGFAGVLKTIRQPVWITDVAAAAALGNDIGTLWDNLLAGRSAIRPITRFPVKRYMARSAACMPELFAQGGRSMLPPLLDLLMQKLGPAPPDTALISATTKAGIDCLERSLHDVSAEQADTLLSSLPEYLSIRLGLNGLAVNVSAACASGTIALARGALLIASGRADAVLICAADLVSEFVFSGFSSLGALSPTSCAPFDRNRCGLSLGEGAAAVMLMSPGRARRENRFCRGRLIGWGVAADAAHLTAPTRDAAGLLSAVHQALSVAGLTPDDISAVSAHGTGTVYNDMMEITAFDRLFGSRPIPVHSVKGAIGHTLGAAGVIEAGVGVLTLNSGIVPPTVGFRDPEQGAAGRVSAGCRPLEGDVLLTVNSGFGGINAALLIQKGDRP